VLHFRLERGYDNYENIEKNLMARLFYIRKENLWRWKLNAINEMVNIYKTDYDIHIKNSLKDEYEIVRKKAQWALEKIKVIDIL
jgi:epoxyqueuosine reductase